MLEATTTHRLSARNNLWANARLHRAAAELGEAEYTKRRGAAFFGTLHGVLSHILVVQWFYIDAVLAERQGRLLRRVDEPFEALSALTDAQRSADLRLVQLCDNLQAEHLLQEVYLERPDAIREATIHTVLLHLFQHQVHHRGQAHALLSDAGLEPPQLDEFFLEEDWKARDAELERLGVPLLRR